MSHLHAPARRLPCRCTVRPGDVEPGTVLTRTCPHGRWSGAVRECSIVPGVLLIDWLPTSSAKESTHA